MKEFKNLTEQINILKDRGLLFLNEENAKSNLIQYGYYEIVNGYKNFILENDDKFYEGETFEHLYSLFELDVNLQNEIMQATKRFEMIVKTALAYHLSDKYGHMESNYLKRTNFKSGKIINGKYEIDILLDKFNKIIEDENEPFLHYRTKQGHIPCWILFKGASIGNLRFFYQLQKSDIKEKVIRTVLGIPISININEEIKQNFGTLMYLSHKYRNRAAHNGRTFCYKPNYNHSPFNSDFHNSIGITRQMFNKGYGKNDLYTFINYLRLLDEKILFINTKVGLEYYIKNHLSLYPNDKNFLLNKMGVPESLIDDYESNNEIFKI